MKMLPLLAAILLAGAPTMVAAQAGPAAVSDAMIEALIEALPDRAKLGVAGEPDPESLERLTALNPGKGPQVRTILESFEACLAPVTTAGVKAMIGRAARKIGPAKTRRMIEFYRSDPVVMTALIDRLKGPAPSAADKAEEARLMADYPLEEYSRAFEQAKAEAAEDAAFIAGAVKCGEAQQAALERAGLKTD